MKVFENPEQIVKNLEENKIKPFRLRKGLIFYMAVWMLMDSDYWGTDLKKRVLKLYNKYPDSVENNGLFHNLIIYALLGE